MAARQGSWREELAVRWIGVVRLRLTRLARGRYVLLWFTRLPPGLGGTFQASEYELQLTGRA